MKEDKSLAESMEQTIEYGNLAFVGDIGEVLLDTVLDDGVLKDIPVLGVLAGVGKCIKNVNNIFFAKKLIAFLYPIKDVPPGQRADALKRWETDRNYRGKVGDTLLGMIERCDDNVKAVWLSKLFYQMVLVKNCPRLFMRAEKTLSSLSVMDVQAFLNLPEPEFSHIKEEEYEPFIGSGLYQIPKIELPADEVVDLGDKYCELTEVGRWIHAVLNDRPMYKVEP